MRIIILFCLVCSFGFCAEKPPAKDELKLERGSSGKIRRVKVIQVIDKENFICYLYKRVWHQTGTLPGSGGYEDKLDMNTACWIEGYDTSDLVDGKSFSPKGEFEYAGTKKEQGNTYYYVKLKKDAPDK